MQRATKQNKAERPEPLRRSEANRLGGIVLGEGLSLAAVFWFLPRRTRQLAYYAGAYLPGAAFHGRFLLAFADGAVKFRAAQLAFNFHVIALEKVLDILSRLVEADDAVPFRA